MKNKYAYLILLFVLTLSLGSCTLYMDDLPEVPTEEESGGDGFTEIKTIKDSATQASYKFYEGVKYIDERYTDYVLVVWDSVTIYFSTGTPFELMPQEGDVIYGIPNKSIFTDIFTAEVKSVIEESGMLKCECIKVDPFERVFEELSIEGELCIDRPVLFTDSTLTPCDDYDAVTRADDDLFTTEIVNFKDYNIGDWFSELETEGPPLGGGRYATYGLSAFDGLELTNGKGVSLSGSFGGTVKISSRVSEKLYYRLSMGESLKVKSVTTTYSKIDANLAITGALKAYIIGNGGKIPFESIKHPFFVGPIPLTWEFDVGVGIQIEGSAGAKFLHEEETVSTAIFENDVLKDPEREIIKSKTEFDATMGDNGISLSVFANFSFGLKVCGVAGLTVGSGIDIGGVFNVNTEYEALDEEGEIRPLKNNEYILPRVTISASLSADVGLEKLWNLGISKSLYTVSTVFGSQKPFYPELVQLTAVRNENTSVDYDVILAVNNEGCFMKPSNVLYYVDIYEVDPEKQEPVFYRQYLFSEEDSEVKKVNGKTCTVYKENIFYELKEGYTYILRPRMECFLVDKYYLTSEPFYLSVPEPSISIKNEIEEVARMPITLDNGREAFTDMFGGYINVIGHQSAYCYGFDIEIEDFWTEEMLFYQRVKFDCKKDGKFPFLGSPDKLGGLSI